MYPTGEHVSGSDDVHDFRLVHSSVAVSTIALGCLLAVGGPLDPAPVVFRDVTAVSGLRFRHYNSATPRKYLVETMTGGVAVLDYDQDGWMDIFLVNGADLTGSGAAPQPVKSHPRFWNRLYRNQGDGTFLDVTERAGVWGDGYGMGAAVGDYDNDGFPDLLVTSFGHCNLYRNNGDGSFRDVTSSAGIDVRGWPSSAGFFDLNNDGFLDLFIGRYLEWSFDLEVPCGSDSGSGRSYCHPDNFPPVLSYLFKNNGDSTFSDISVESGIAAHPGKALGVAFADFDGDGFADIYVANDSFQQFLFKNLGNESFEEVGISAGVAFTEDGRVFAGMGADFMDVDGDGMPDIVATALPYESFAFFHNRGNGMFDYRSLDTHLARLTRFASGWGVRIFDYDNDGRNDLFLVNGHVMDNIEASQPNLEYRQRPMLLRNAGSKFVDVSASSGDPFQNRFAGRGAAFADLDNDGDIDVVVSNCNEPAYVLRNDGGNRNPWIGLRLRGTRSTRDGIGARVEIVGDGDEHFYSQATSTASYLSSVDPRVLVGLGSTKELQKVRVRWPSGTEQIIEGPALRQYHEVVEPESAGP